jgi:predicted metal-dependent enzyme (double-stranded beta helix superfamily)
MPKANLSIVAQKLYDCIAGKQFVLDSSDFPDFSKAIEHSIKTPGLWCHERLKQKATEFDKDKPDEKETYLRITLGENSGESPGIPYVMEIWPSGHYSPIHNHAGASAVIRVLHGSINVSLFPFLSGDALEPFGKADFNQGDITWISPSLNQIHQLKNTDKTTTCITIQCYMYKQGNITHYDYFDYLDAAGNKQQYEPDSDMEFVAFKKRMRKEWLETGQVTQPEKKSWSSCFIW